MFLLAKCLDCLIHFFGRISLKLENSTLAYTSLRLTSLQVRLEGRSHVVLLYADREFFNRDISKLRAVLDRERFVRVSSSALCVVMKERVAPSLCVQAPTLEILAQGEFQIKALSEEIEDLFGRSVEMVAAYVTASIDYYQDLPWRRICKERDIQFWVLWKEHPITERATRELREALGSRSGQYEDVTVFCASDFLLQQLIETRNCAAGSAVIPMMRMWPESKISSSRNPNRQFPRRCRIPKYFRRPHHRGLIAVVLLENSGGYGADCESYEWLKARLQSVLAQLSFQYPKTGVLIERRKHYSLASRLISRPIEKYVRATSFGGRRLVQLRNLERYSKYRAEEVVFVGLGSLLMVETMYKGLRTVSLEGCLKVSDDERVFDAALRSTYRNLSIPDGIPQLNEIIASLFDSKETNVSGWDVAGPLPLSRLPEDPHIPQWSEQRIQDLLRTRLYRA